jgi:pyruvate dehydrogenase phosphatase regulatory subunit
MKKIGNFWRKKLNHDVDSSFAKFDLWSAGSEVVDFLQYTCSNDIDIPVGM